MLAEQFEPLKNVQVWRFSLYYFFVFGAFVALALWLPRYLIGVYGVDIKTAGMLAAAFSVPASSVSDLWRHLSDKVGARQVMYWTFLRRRDADLSCCPIRRPTMSRSTASRARSLSTWMSLGLVPSPSRSSCSASS
jgi:hypothetical protein